MKVAIVTETFLPSTDGIVLRLKELIKELVAQNHEVIVIAPDLGVKSYKGVPIHGIKAVKIPFYRFRKWSLPSRKVHKILKAFNPDVIHAATPLLMGVSAVRYAKNHNIPLVCSYHTHIPKYLDYYKVYIPYAKRLMWFYINLIHKNADVNLCTSEAMYKVLKLHGMKRLKVIKRGVDLSKRDPRFKDASMRDYLTSGHPEKKLIVFIGRLAVEKEIHKIKPLLLQRNDICLAIIGDGPARQALEQTFKGTSTLFTGFLHGNDLSKAYATADAFIFPSISETLGLVILESMSSGTPIIAAKSGPTNEQIQHLHNGLLFENENLESLMTAVNSLDNDILMHKIIQQGRKDAIENSWPNTSRDLIDKYYVAIDLNHSSDHKKPSKTSKLKLKKIL